MIKRSWLINLIIFIAFLTLSFDKPGPEKVLTTYSPTDEFVIITQSVEQYFSKIIPAQFIPIVRDIAKSDDCWFYIVALGFQESEWKYFRSVRPNRDGSIDLGALGLNSKNRNDDWFLERFGGTTYPIDSDGWHIETCYNYFKYLYNRLGLEGALISYNGGLTRYLRGSPPSAALRYRDQVINRIATFQSDYQPRRVMRVPVHLQ